MSFRGCVGAGSKDTAVVSLLVGMGIHRVAVAKGRSPPVQSRFAPGGLLRWRLSFGPSFVALGGQLVESFLYYGRLVSAASLAGLLVLSSAHGKRYGKG